LWAAKTKAKSGVEKGIFATELTQNRARLVMLRMQKPSKKESQSKYMKDRNPSY
jgi:hypothetical protein